MSFTKTRISKILITLDNSESTINAVDYALLIAKGLNAELVAMHVVRTEDALVATNWLIEDLETVAMGDSILQKVKEEAQKWFSTIKQKGSAYGIQSKTAEIANPKS